MSLGRRLTLTLIFSVVLFCSINVGIMFRLNASPLPSIATSSNNDFRLSDETEESISENQRQHKLNHDLSLPIVSDNVEPITRPKLRSIVQGWNITGDPSWLLQFSIVGFPKCGTSTLMFHLRTHPEIQMFKDERCELGSNQHARLIEDLYRKFPPSNTTHRFVRGIKCPSELETTKLSMRNYRKFFSKTDFIVGVRHPVLWFESFYNFRIHNHYKMPPAENLIGTCRKGWNFVCTFRSNFHIFLSNLGKTNMSHDAEEQNYIDEKYRKTMDPVPTKRRVFLYEISQLSDPNETRAEQFRLDLQTFLYLKNPIDPFIWYKPGRNHSNSVDRESAMLGKIDICDDRYLHLRSVLVHHATQASQWIRKYFIHAEGVVVSSKDYWESTLLESWEHDPCVEGRERVPMS